MKTFIVIMAILAMFIGAAWLLTQGQPAITKAVQVTLSVKPAPDFTLVVDPMHVNSPIGRTVGYNATVTSVNNFAGVVTFSVSGLPEGFTISYFPSNTLTLDAGAPKGIQINIDIADDPGLVADYTITITAESTSYN